MLYCDSCQQPLALTKGTAMTTIRIPNNYIDYRTEESPDDIIVAATKNQLQVAAHRINTDSEARKQILALIPAKTQKAGA